jgi:hypothetical protein
MRNRNPFGDDLTDLLIVGAIGVAGYLVWRSIYPSQSDTYSAPTAPAIGAPSLSTVQNDASAYDVGQINLSGWA